MQAYSITVDAPAAVLYRLVADPHRHHEIDGSGTVKPRVIGPHELTEGARFTVHMRKYGVPYRMPLRVTRAQPPAQGRPGMLEWRQPAGHRWRWEFHEHDDDAGTTTVTEAYDAADQYRLFRIGLGLAGVPQENADSIQASLHRVREVFAPGQTHSG